MHTANLTVLLLALLAVGCSGTATAPATAVPDGDGQALYGRFCAVCHGEDGRSVEGTNSPHLNSQGLLTVVDDAFLFDNTALGRPGENGRGKPGTKMSIYDRALGGPLTDSEIGLIVAYMRQWQTEPSVALEPYTADGDPGAGKVTYDELCASCHGDDGWSAEAPSLAGGTLQETASDAFLRHSVLYGREGTTMPGFSLENGELADLIGYVRTLDDTSSEADQP